MTRQVRLSAAATAAAAAFALSAASPARAAVVPQFSFGDGSAQQSPGSPGGSVYGSDLAFPSGTAKADPAFNKHSISFYNGGTTVATAGLAHAESTNLAKITFASGTGISQTDPLHSQSESRLDVNFYAQFNLSGGTFGPPINTSFSIPIGVKVGTGGYAAFAGDVHWDLSISSEETFISDARAPYVIPATTFGPGTRLLSFTAPAAPFARSSLNVPGGGASVIMRGTLVFTANNDDAPVLVEIPTAENFGDQPDFAQYNYEAGVTVNADVPEPATAGTVGLAVAAGLLVRRRRPARR